MVEHCYSFCQVFSQFYQVISAPILYFLQLITSTFIQLKWECKHLAWRNAVRTIEEVFFPSLTVTPLCILCSLQIDPPLFFSGPLDNIISWLMSNSPEHRQSFECILWKSNWEDEYQIIVYRLQNQIQLWLNACLWRLQLKSNLKVCYFLI